MSDQQHRLWIVRAKGEEYGQVYLPDYSGSFKHDVERKVMDGARRENYRGTLTERLAYLDWQIVCVGLVECEGERPAA